MSMYWDNIHNSEADKRKKEAVKRPTLNDILGDNMTGLFNFCDRICNGNLDVIVTYHNYDDNNDIKFFNLSYKSKCILEVYKPRYMSIVYLREHVRNFLLNCDIHNINEDTKLFYVKCGYQQQ